MKRIAWILPLLLLLGCDLDLPQALDPNEFLKAEQTTHKVDGKVVKIEVTLPRRRSSQSRHEVEFTSREDVERYIAEIESMLIDLKEAQEQMVVHEPTLDPKEE